MNQPVDEDRLWTLGDVARYLGCTPRHVQNLVVAGLPHLKLGRLIRFDRREVAGYLRKNRGVRRRR